MPFDVQRDGSTVRVVIELPMVGAWPVLMDEIEADLDPRPETVYLPEALEDASPTDAGMLQIMWRGLESLGIEVLPLQSDPAAAG
jgi:hypothetical protein